MGEIREGTKRQIETLKTLRSRFNMSQNDLSVYLGIPKRTIEDWETGRRKMRDYELKLICYYVGISHAMKEIRTKEQIEESNDFDDIIIQRIIEKYGDVEECEKTKG